MDFLAGRSRRTAAWSRRHVAGDLRSAARAHGPPVHPACRRAGSRRDPACGRRARKPDEHRRRHAGCRRHAGWNPVCDICRSPGVRPGGICLLGGGGDAAPAAGRAGRSRVSAPRLQPGLATALHRRLAGSHRMAPAAAARCSRARGHPDRRPAAAGPSGHHFRCGLRRVPRQLRRLDAGAAGLGDPGPQQNLRSPQRFRRRRDRRCDRVSGRRTDHLVHHAGPAQGQPARPDPAVHRHHAGRHDRVFLGDRNS